MGEWECRPAGEGSLYVLVGERPVREVTQEVQVVVRALREGLGSRLLDVVPGYISVYVEFDPQLWGFGELRAAIAALAQAPRTPAQPRLITVPVCYGGAWGPDLGAVAARNGLTEEEVVRRHLAPTYEVAFIGFTPGFPFLTGLDEQLVTPRLPVPRRRVPQGSVGIAGEQTGIYPVASPGGWRIIGRTGLSLFTPTSAEPVLMRPGDRVRFVPSPESLPVDPFLEVGPGGTG